VNVFLFFEKNKNKFTDRKLEVLTGIERSSKLETAARTSG
jgi:hypothetical protein